MMTTAISNAVVIYALAGAISMLVALLIKGLFVIVRRMSKGDDSGA